MALGQVLTSTVLSSHSLLKSRIRADGMMYSLSLEQVGAAGRQESGTLAESVLSSEWRTFVRYTVKMSSHHAFSHDK
jgi:hypothetical protein